ncbi:hypothetical protein O3689_12725 [Prevotella nigrescens]
MPEVKIEKKLHQIIIEMRKSLKKTVCKLFL